MATKKSKGKEKKQQQAQERIRFQMSRPEFQDISTKYSVFMCVQQQNIDSLKKFFQGLGDNTKFTIDENGITCFDRRGNNIYSQIELSADIFCDLYISKPTTIVLDGYQIHQELKEMQDPYLVMIKMFNETYLQQENINDLQNKLNQGGASKRQEGARGSYQLNHLYIDLSYDQHTTHHGFKIIKNMDIAKHCKQLELEDKEDQVKFPEDEDDSADQQVQALMSMLNSNKKQLTIDLTYKFIKLFCKHKQKQKDAQFFLEINHAPQHCRVNLEKISVSSPEKNSDVYLKPIVQVAMDQKGIFLQSDVSLCTRFLQAFKPDIISLQTILQKSLQFFILKGTSDFIKYQIILFGSPSEGESEDSQ